MAIPTELPPPCPNSATWRGKRNPLRGPPGVGRVWRNCHDPIDPSRRLARRLEEGGSPEQTAPASLLWEQSLTPHLMAWQLANASSGPQHLVLLIQMKPLPWPN